MINISSLLKRRKVLPIEQHDSPSVGQDVPPFTSSSHLSGVRQLSAGQFSPEN